jgi:hypothetical protein
MRNHRIESRQPDMRRSHPLQRSQSSRVWQHSEKSFPYRNKSRSWNRGWSKNWPLPKSAVETPIYGRWKRTSLSSRGWRSFRVYREFTQPVGGVICSFLISFCDHTYRFGPDERRFESIVCTDRKDDGLLGFVDNGRHPQFPRAYYG